MKLSTFFTVQTDEPYLNEIFSGFHLQGVRQILPIRLFLAIGGMLWVFLFAKTNALYYLSLFAVYLGITLVYLVLSRRAAYTIYHTYFLYFLDIVLLGIGLLYPLHDTGALPAGMMGEQLFYCLVLLATACFTYCAEVIAFVSLLTLITWCGGFFLLPEQSPRFSEAVQYIALFALAGTLSAWSFYRLRRLMFEQIKDEREFNELLSSQGGKNDELGESPHYIDRMTGLGTRAAFERDSSLFTTVFAEGRLKDLTIAFIEVENPRELLKEYGQEGYQKVLAEFADSAKKKFRSSDMVYRFSSDQFVLLAPGSTISNGERLQSLLDSIIADVHAAGLELFKASMGMSTLGEVQKLADGAKEE